MGNPPIAESLIGAFVAMALVVTFRRGTSRVIEFAVWIGLIWVCIVAVTGGGDPQARALTTAAVWGSAQVAGMVIDLARQDVLRWAYETRFLIADWVVLLVGVDVLLLALVATRRQADGGMPMTKLREWWVLPRARATQTQLAPVTGVDALNRRFSAWCGPATTATAMAATLFLIWLRDFQVPHMASGLKHLRLPEREGRPVAAESLSLGPDIVRIDTFAEGVRTRRTPRRRITDMALRPEAIDNKNVSKKHRQGRLAS
jgi:hypothetical protein